MKTIKEFRGWALLDEMPEGWRIDKNCGSPIFGYVFVTNGKSMFNGQKRALLRVRHAPASETLEACIERISPQENKPVQVIDDNYLRTVNELARQKFEHRLLNDLMVDLTICEIEGWCKTEYLEELKNLINSIGEKNDNPTKHPNLRPR